MKDISLPILAQLGDAVHYLISVEGSMTVCKRSNELHQRVVSLVSAVSQANLLDFLKPYLFEHELDLVRRARNCKSIKKVKIKQSVYRKATALEVLFGYLYLEDKKRLMYLISLNELYK